MMKKIISPLLFTCSLLVFSCGNPQNKVVQQDKGVPKDKVIQKETISEPEEKENKYESDWKLFQKSIATNDYGAIEKMMAIEGTNFESISYAFDDSLKKKLAATPYDKLEESDFEGIPVKEFSFEESSINDEGHEVGSAIFLYFQETESGLKLVNFLAAG